jgi:hypothetical protein
VSEGAFHRAAISSHIRVDRALLFRSEHCAAGNRFTLFAYECHTLVV